MDNESKAELRREVVRLAIVGYDKKKIIEILEPRGFKKQTISKYYEALKGRVKK